MPPATIGSPPENLEAEQALLGSILANSNTFLGVLDSGLLAGDFYLPVHAEVFAAMVALNARGESIDTVTMFNELPNCEMIQKNPSYLATLSLASPALGTLHVPEYAAIVHRRSLERQLQELSFRLGRVAEGQSASVGEDAQVILAKIEPVVRGLGQRTIGSALKDALHTLLGKVTGEIVDDSVIRTGIVRLNKLLEGGLRRTDLTLVAGRTSHGKTALAATIIYHVAIRDAVPCILYTYEMSEEQMLQRLVAMTAGVALSVIRNGAIDAESPLLSRVIEAQAKIYDRVCDGSLDIVSAPGWTADEIAADIARRNQERRLAIACVDYLGLVASPARLHGSNRVAQLSHTTSQLKQVAVRENVNLLALSQLNREVEHRKGAPQLSDLRESGSLEQDSNQVIFVYPAPEGTTAPPDGYSVSILDLQKNRNGEQGRVELLYRGALTQFMDYAA